MLNPPELRSWPSLEKNFKDAQCILLPAGGAKVHSMQVCTSFEGVVVTFEDGSCHSISDTDFGGAAPAGLGVAAAAEPKSARKGKRRREDPTGDAVLVWSELLREQKTGSTRVLTLVVSPCGVAAPCRRCQLPPCLWVFVSLFSHHLLRGVHTPAHLCTSLPPFVALPGRCRRASHPLPQHAGWRGYVRHRPAEVVDPRGHQHPVRGHLRRRVSGRGNIIASPARFLTPPHGVLHLMNSRRG